MCSVLSREGFHTALADDGNAVCARLPRLARKAVEIGRNEKAGAFRHEWFHDKSCLDETVFQLVSGLAHHTGQNDDVTS
jgi:hypothetical protein